MNMPSITPEHDSDALLARLESMGYTLIENAPSNDHVARLVRRMDELLPTHAALPTRGQPSPPTAKSVILNFLQNPQIDKAPAPRYSGGLAQSTGCSAAWLARLTGGQEVGGSNPPTPIGRKGRPHRRLFLWPLFRLSETSVTSISTEAPWRNWQTQGT